jgi:hypothetical protein
VELKIGFDGVSVEPVFEIEPEPEPLPQQQCFFQK